MPYFTIITDETHNKRYAQIDLEQLATIEREELEDVMDVSIAEARRNEPKITLSELEHWLREKK